MYSYDHHIGYANGCLCFPCACVCVCMCQPNVHICASAYIRVHIHIYECLQCDRIYSNVSGLTNRAVNIVSQLFIDLVNVIKHSGPILSSQTYGPLCTLNTLEI